MNSPLLPFQVGAITRIETVLAANGHTGDRVWVDPPHGQALPYVVCGSDTLIRSSTKDNDMTELTHTFVAWSDSMDEAKTVADYVIQALTDNSNLVSVANFTVTMNDLDFIGSPLVDEDEGGNDNRYGVPVRVRYILREA